MILLHRAYSWSFLKECVETGVLKNAFIYLGIGLLASITSFATVIHTGSPVVLIYSVSQINFQIEPSLIRFYLCLEVFGDKAVYRIQS